MLKRTEYFANFYTQQEAAEVLGTSARMLIYWEKQGLIKSHPVGGGRGKYRGYSEEDIHFIRFVMRLLENGLSTKAVRERIEKLPEGYEPEKLLWDDGERRWRTPEEVTRSFLRSRYEEIMRSPDPPAKIVEMFFDFLEGGSPR